MLQRSVGMNFPILFTISPILPSEMITEIIGQFHISVIAKMCEDDTFGALRGERLGGIIIVTISGLVTQDDKSSS
ncbi:unnamed protein product [Phytomonas sp. Hart1]|nr:unnamed protein product [Phytomonas sp. Hart1]|eukprot:CCW70065.1 unnamed protein product [Phytomonas sp. isolate Hart1]